MKFCFSALLENDQRVLLIAAAILAARKLSQLQTIAPGRSLAFVATVTDAVRWAEEILKEIDRRWPTK